jgi:3-dehydroquinate synthase
VIAQLPADARVAPEVVPVALGARSYEILIGPRLIEEAGSRIAALRPGAAAFVVCDANLETIHLPSLDRSLRAAGIRIAKAAIPPGEASKDFSTLERLVDAILAAKIERNDLVIALGGGVVGDLAGFAAAIARRGIDVVQIPTTLLAQVDSSVGGKTGINTRHGKNLVGAFHQPCLVLADIDTLSTLPKREFRAGYAEVAKYGLLGDPLFFAWLEQYWRNVFSGGPARMRAVTVSCRMKAAIVGRDERETGERALLNLGHTFGHALETATGFSERLLHGEAIAIGMVLAFRLSARLKLCAADDAERAVAHFAAVGLPTKLADVPGSLPNADGLLELMAQDKKMRRGAPTFVLTRGIGKAFIAHDVDAADVRALLDAERRNP